MDPRTLAEAVCGKVGRNLTREEWCQFIGPDIAYEPTCKGLPGDANAEAPALDLTPATCSLTLRRC